MNVFNAALSDILDDIFSSVNVTHDESTTMVIHFENSNYSRLHIISCWRDDDGVLCVRYDDGCFFHYKNGEWYQKGDFMRIQVNLSDDIVEKLDLYAKKIGVSRSAFCAMSIGQTVMTYEKSFDIVKEIGEKALAENSPTV